MTEHVHVHVHGGRPRPHPYGCGFWVALVFLVGLAIVYWWIALPVAALLIGLAVVSAHSKRARIQEHQAQLAPLRRVMRTTIMEMDAGLQPRKMGALDEATREGAITGAEAREYRWRWTYGPAPPKD